jgi:3-methylfumaryl-CoA hydratase
MELDYSEWIGRQEEANDFISPGPIDRLAATLDRDDPPARNGDAIPPLAHWLFFLPNARQSEIGPDGHPRRGGFLPPVHDLPRRMWAGSRISFQGEIRVGQELRRRSTVQSVKRKEGKSGPLVFVTVRHEYMAEGSETVLLTDEHEIVYRGLEGAAVKQAPKAEGPDAAWKRTVRPDDVLLFRYSALTFNGHRIHYARDYVTRVEGYPGLIVHGPLIATLLVDLVRRNDPAARIARFAFRAVSPLFDTDEIHLNGGAPDKDGNIRLWATNGEGRLAMTAEAGLKTAPS